MFSNGWVGLNNRSISYKEQARLNQAACNALMARLDCQKMTCEAAEKDLLQRYSQREALAALVKPDLNGTAQKKPLRGRDIVDVSSCLSMVTTSDGQLVTPEKGLPRGDISEQNSDIEDLDDVPSVQEHNGRSLEFVRQEILNREITPTKREKGKASFSLSFLFSLDYTIERDIFFSVKCILIESCEVY